MATTKPHNIHLNMSTKHRNTLKLIADLKGKTLMETVAVALEDYIQKHKGELENLFKERLKTIK